MSTVSWPEYIGCFIDNNNARDLMDPAILVNTPMSVELCVHTCNQANYLFAGVQYGSQCFCGNRTGSLGTVSETECNRTCTGNADEVCGGVDRNSVYLSRTTNYLNSTIITSVVTVYPNNYFSYDTGIALSVITSVLGVICIGLSFLLIIKKRKNNKNTQMNKTEFNIQLTNKSNPINKLNE